METHHDSDGVPMGQALAQVEWAGEGSFRPITIATISSARAGNADLRDGLMERT